VHESIDESVVDLLVHIDAFHRATALTGVVHGAVGQRLGGHLRVGVFTDVTRVLAAELELQPDEAAPPPFARYGARGHRTGEEHAVDVLRSSACPTSPVPTRQVITSCGTPGFVQQRAICRPVMAANSEGL
jgi:hypothetical protein